MVRVRYTGNAGRYKLTNSDVNVEQGEAVDIDEETAEYLLDRDDFEPADDDLADSADDGEAATGTCDVEKSDGEVCGRDLPCPYHSDDELEG